MSRYGNKWSVNEILSLQREYELLGMSIQEIAIKHKRTVQAILYKLESENFITDWSSARGFNQAYDEQPNELDDEQTVTEDTVESLIDRVWNLETTVNDISGMVKQMFEVMTNNNSSNKRNPLIKQSSRV